MNNKTFFDEETVEKVREHDKELIALNKKKADFNKINTAMDSYGKFNVENEELLKAYVGEKYPKFMTTKFNIWAFLFGPFYLLYRKMYLYGFLLSLFSSIINSFFTKINLSSLSLTSTFIVNVNLTSIIIIIFVDLLISLIMGLSFNKLYIGTCINDVMRLKLDYPTMDTMELCKKKGGTSIALALVANLAIYVLVSVIMNLL